jgi:hypothetical protein
MRMTFKLINEKMELFVTKSTFKKQKTTSREMHGSKDQMNK